MNCPREILSQWLTKWYPKWSDKDKQSKKNVPLIEHTYKLYCEIKSIVVRFYLILACVYGAGRGRKGGKR